MAKQQILLVDADSSSARLLEVSLRSAGFTVATADSAEDALAKLEHGTPDLILTDTALPKADGFSFVRKLRSRPESAEVPVVFLTEQGALEDKLRGLELGVDDYLAKPIFVREVVTRVQLLLARKRQRIAPEPARTRFSGSLEDVAVVDLLQTIAVSGKSGVASVRRGDREAWLYFERGQVIDAEVGDLRGEEAVYRTISWTTGSFDLEFRPSDRAKVIDAPYQALLMEGLRRVDELGRIAEQLPPEDAVIDLDHAALASRLNEIPDELNAILRLIDGKRTLLDLIDASPFDDLSTLTVLSKFYFEGLISSTDPVAEGSERPLAYPNTASAAPSSAPRDMIARDSESRESDSRDMGEVATLVPSSPPSDAPRDIGQVETLVPPSRSTPAGAVPTVPPARLPQTSPPSTVPAELDPPREARRETPAPVTARAAAPAPVMEGKLTPKGIVNVGEHGSIPAKPAASPFHVVAPQPRRSPIPMPDGSLRASGAAHGSGALQASGAEAEELRQTRTSLGLSAVPVQSSLQPPVRASVESSLQSSLQRPSPERGPLAVPPAPEHDRTASPVANPRAAAAPAVSAAPAAAPTRTAAPKAPAAVAPAAVAPAPGASDKRPAEGAASGSNPASEKDFFEAGDEGTYEGGPLSDVPELRLDHESAPAPPPAPRRPSPVRAERARRGKVVVGAILALASAPLVIGLAQRLASRPDVPPPAAEPTQTITAAPAPAPPAGAPPASPAPASPAAVAPPVTAPPVTAPPVTAPPAPALATPAAASAPGPASPPVAGAQPSAPAAAPTPPGATPAAPKLAAPQPAAPRPAAPTPAQREAAPVPSGDAPTAPRAVPPRATKTPPRATKPADAPAPAPAAPTRPAALPPLDIPVAPQLPKAGEKPPTAAFPVR